MSNEFNPEATEKRTFPSPVLKSLDMSEAKTEVALGCLTAAEVVALFVGMAIIISATSLLLLRSSLGNEGFVLGLTFAQDVIQFSSGFFEMYFISIAASIILTIVCDYSLRAKKELNEIPTEKINLKYIVYYLFTYSKILIILFFVLGMLVSGMIDSKLFFISISVLLFSLFIKCTMACRILLFFMFFNLLIIFNYFKDSMLDHVVNIPIVISIDGYEKPKCALSCVISKEGFAVIRYGEIDTELVPISRIKSIKKAYSVEFDPTKIDNLEILDHKR